MDPGRCDAGFDLKATVGESGACGPTHTTTNRNHGNRIESIFPHEGGTASATHSCLSLDAFVYSLAEPAHMPLTPQAQGPEPEGLDSIQKLS